MPPIRPVGTLFRSSASSTLGDLNQVLKFVFRGQLKPVVDSVYPLAEIRAAHERLEKREQFGKIVVTL